MQRRISVFCCIVLCLLSGGVFADPAVDIQQSLSFGRYVLRNNNLNAQLQITYDGLVNADPAFIPVNSTARNGIIRLTGFTPAEVLDLSISFTPNPLTMTCTCPSPDFVVSNFQTETQSVTIDVNGEARIRYGATITAQGGAYTDVTYTGTVNISVIVNN